MAHAHPQFTDQPMVSLYSFYVVGWSVTVGIALCAQNACGDTQASSHKEIKDIGTYRSLSVHAFWFIFFLSFSFILGQLSNKDKRIWCNKFLQVGPDKEKGKENECADSGTTFPHFFFMHWPVPSESRLVSHTVTWPCIIKEMSKKVVCGFSFHSSLISWPQATASWKPLPGQDY